MGARPVPSAIRKAFKEKIRGAGVLNCPECTHREKVKVQEKYEQDVEEEDRDRNELFKLFDEIEFPMKSDSRTKHFTCRKCGLYATREQIYDLRERLGRRGRTREDRHDDYLNWWQKSKRDK